MNNKQISSDLFTEEIKRSECSWCTLYPALDTACSLLLLSHGSAIHSQKEAHCNLKAIKCSACCSCFKAGVWKLLGGMFSSHSTCLLDVSNSITPICQLGLMCGIVKQRQCHGIALHPLSSVGRCLLGAVPKDMFHSYCHISGHVPLAWPLQRHSCHVNHVLGSQDFWRSRGLLMTCVRVGLAVFGHHPTGK